MPSFCKCVILSVLIAGVVANPNVQQNTSYANDVSDFESYSNPSNTDPNGSDVTEDCKDDVKVDYTVPPAPNNNNTNPTPTAVSLSSEKSLNLSTSTLPATGALTAEKPSESNEPSTGTQSGHSTHPPLTPTTASLSLQNASDPYRSPSPATDALTAKKPSESNVPASGKTKDAHSSAPPATEALTAEKPSESNVPPTLKKDSHFSILPSPPSPISLSSQNSSDPKNSHSPATGALTADKPSESNVPPTGSQNGLPTTPPLTPTTTTDSLSIRNGSDTYMSATQATVALTAKKPSESGHSDSASKATDSLNRPNPENCKNSTHLGSKTDSLDLTRLEECQNEHEKPVDSKSKSNLDQTSLGNHTTPTKVYDSDENLSLADPDQKDHSSDHTKRSFSPRYFRRWRMWGSWVDRE